MKKVRVQKFTIEHARNKAYIKWLNDKEVTKFLGREDLENVKTQDALIYFKAVESNDLAYFYALYDSCSDTFIGTCKVSLLAASGIKGGICDLGIMIGDKNFWGKGYGSESIKIVANMCFESLNIRKITAGCYSNNIAMIKAFQNNGFKIEGVLKKQLKYNKEYVDHILFGCFIEDLL